MKILYLVFACLFLAFLSQPGNAHHVCGRQGGGCYRSRCPPNHTDLGQEDCNLGEKCCRSWSGK